jgi:hypothetical protein
VYWSQPLQSIRRIRLSNPPNSVVIFPRRIWLPDTAGLASTSVIASVMASRSSGTNGYLCPIRFSQPRPNVGPGGDRHGRLPDDVASGYLAVDCEGHGQLGAREARGYLGPRTWPSGGRAGVATIGRSAVVQPRRERVVLHVVLIIGMCVSGSAALGTWCREVVAVSRSTVSQRTLNRYPCRCVGARPCRVASRTCTHRGARSRSAAEHLAATQAARNVGQRVDRSVQ